MKKIIDLYKINFLVIDDIEFSRTIIASILRALGADPKNIHKASDGIDALSRISAVMPEIVIVDYLMRPMDGIAFTAAVRRRLDPPLQTVPVIMLSSFTDESLVARARDAGVTEYVSKPVSIEALYRRIEEVILRPRQFVIAPNYVGPDRQRRSDTHYEGPRRRKGDVMASREAGEEV